MLAKHVENVALEKLPLAEGLEAARRIGAKDLAQRLVVIHKILEVLGLEHSCAERVWTDAEWRALVPAFEAERDWPDAPEGEFRRCSLSKRMGAVFQLRHWRSRAEGAAIHKPPMRLKEDLTQVLSRWAGAEIKATKVASKARVGATDGWADAEKELKAAWRVEFRENPEFAPLAGFEAAPGRSPAKARSQAIEAAVGERWRAWKAEQGVGGREDTYEFCTVPVPNLWASVAPYEAVVTKKTEKSTFDPLQFHTLI
jgi:hypothetical protein